MNKITVTKRKAEKLQPEIRVGQIYRMIDTDRFFMVVDLYDSYSLIELSDGVAWDTITENIDHVFASHNLGENFELMENLSWMTGEFIPPDTQHKDKFN